MARRPKSELMPQAVDNLEQLGYAIVPDLSVLFSFGKSVRRVSRPQSSVVSPKLSNKSK
jgi:hypothetical protein